MCTLQKEDIKILDYILETCLKSGSASYRNLKSLSNLPLSDIPDIINGDYEPYFKIIEESRVAKIETDFNNNKYIKPIDKITQQFCDNGGFQKKYEDQEAQIDYEARMKQKNLDDAKVSRWKKSSFWYTFGIALATVLIALISLFIRHK